MGSTLAVVTGGAGFIGGHLVHQLHERGIRVRVLDIADPRGDFPGDVEYIQGSVLDAQVVSKALKGAIHLYHLAANPQLWARNKQDFFRVNYEGTRTVFEQAARVDLERIVFTSTETILTGYKAHNGRPISEASELPSVDELPGPYSQSKMLADRVAQQAAQNGMPVVIVNPTIPIGPGDVNLTPPTQMILGFLQGKHPAYLDCDMNIIPVEDAALGHILAAEKGNVGDRYILGNENMRLRQILDILEEGVGRKMPRFRIPSSVALLTSVIAESLANNILRQKPVASLEGVRIANARMVFDCTKARRELGLPTGSSRNAIVAAAKGLLEKEVHPKTLNAIHKKNPAILIQ